MGSREVTCTGQVKIHYSIDYLLRSAMNEHNHHSILTGNILNQVENHVSEHGQLELKLTGFVDKITVSIYAIATSFDDDKTRSQLKKLKYKNSVDLLNAAYQKLGVDRLSPAEIDSCIAGEIEYWYLDINFSTPKPPGVESYYKFQMHNYMIFSCAAEADDPDDRADGLRILYSNQFNLNYVQNFDRAIYLDLDNPDLDPQAQTAITQLESAIYGICRTIEVEIPTHLQSEALDRLIIQPPTLETFRSLLELLTRNKYEDKEYLKDAKKLQTFSKKKVVDEFDLHFKVRDILDRYDAAYYSDWKFDPEDIEYGISIILETEFTFEYPEETYSDSLFPYLQTELASRDLIMLNIDTSGDSYLFCIVNIADVESVLQLAQAIDLKIVKI